jgi:quinol monooxygenase YgiN
MKLPANLVTIHPYFKIHPGKEEQVAAVLEKFVAKTRGEPMCLFYEFSCLGDIVFCREGYEGAAGVNHHLENIGDVLAEMLTVSDLMRLEFHGPAEEIDQLRGSPRSLECRLVRVALWHLSESSRIPYTHGSR